MYDVYLTCIDDDEQVPWDRNTWNIIQDQNLIFFFFKKKLTMNSETAKESNGEQN
jgi:hypothetical protein